MHWCEFLASSGTCGHMVPGGVDVQGIWRMGGLGFMTRQAECAWGFLHMLDPEGGKEGREESPRLVCWRSELVN